jgi:polyribonucleotide nucleotidyltransferase
MKQCTECGTWSRAQARFCKGCGVPFVNTDVAVAAQLPCVTSTEVPRTTAESGQSVFETTSKEQLHRPLQPVLWQQYQGKVIQVLPFGAVVEILPNITGILHVSEYSKKHVARIADHLKTGDTVTVKLIQLGDTGKMKLSRKAALGETA